MPNKPFIISFTAIFMLVFQTYACTNLLVTRGASSDGSTMITYTCDGVFHAHLRSAPATDHKPGDSVEVVDWYGKVYGKIPQVTHTYAYVGYMNEHQLAISETTFEGREELKNPDGLLHYKDLIIFSLERAKTAREALTVMTGLVEKYGYRSSGESISIADKKEVWILEIIGPGPGGKGAIWVAVKVPDGYISAHANKARIGTFPLKDPKNCIYSKNVISFAKEKGYWDPKSKKLFLFNEAYCPTTPKNNRYADTRVWSIFRRAAPSKKFSPDYHRSVDGAKPYPLWIKPDKKLSLADVFALMRDHYEGTDFDMRKGIDAGPYGSPNRWRPLSWMHDSVEYIWERPISTQQTGYSFVSQSRSNLPDAAGGVLWYGMDDTYMTCYVPLYCSITDIPKSFTVGSLDKFSWESAWWVFNFVANWANLKYSYMMPEIVAVQKELEENFLAQQSAIEKTALALGKKDKKQMVRFLTDYSVTKGEIVVKRWKELAEYLMTKYNDGYVRNKEGKSEEKGYHEEWTKRVLKENPAQFKLKERKEKVPESKLID
jgi:dipeptidase